MARYEVNPDVVLRAQALIACGYRASEWRHEQVERAAYGLLQELDRAAGID